ncbi:helix-turn-helix domain-containing protein [Niabella pedocola]|uniref:Helix-turn-helix domain-containing protein n=1 Tax=Niabella pedocola TaxID=1752077 RepID=A0ABS8PLW5_9BACT|nr:helix-turn-helix transcriptional regulator [Niabella pedocola]MCD2422097.1 helix-turn-helix domain-containing protein [Niabella pedocola]
MIYFRQQTTFSQTELAALLDVSKSSISMHEKGGRSLPLEAERQLLALQKAWTLFLQEPPFADYAFIATSTGFTRLRSLLNTCTQRAAADAVRYSQQLEKIRDTCKTLERKQRFLRYLMQQESPAAIPQPVLKNLELEIRNRLKNCSMEHQRILIFRINLSTALQQVALAAGKGLP